MPSRFYSAASGKQTIIRTIIITILYFSPEKFNKIYRDMKMSKRKRRSDTYWKITDETHIIICKSRRRGNSERYRRSLTTRRAKINVTRVNKALEFCQRTNGKRNSRPSAWQT